MLDLPTECMYDAGINNGETTEESIMGRQNFNVTAKGRTMDETQRNAIADAEAEYGHQEGYSGAINCATDLHWECIKKPILSKRCKVDKSVQKGVRKWETVYVIGPIRDSDWFHRKSLRKYELNLYLSV